MSQPNRFFVVGVGASAGGLEATQQFFKHISPGSRAAFVVVQHLSPDFKSLMNELLVKYTDLPIVKLTESTDIEPGHIYLMSSQKNVVVEHRTLKPVEHDKSNKVNLPIDLFFHSLGKAWQDQAIGVVLSGTGTDGSRGIRTIHEQNGIVMVQKPENAKFDGMPRTAINSGVADFVLNTDQIAQEINRIVNARNAPQSVTPPKKLLISEEDYLKEILGMAYGQTKIDFSQYRPETILRRLTKRLFVVNQSSIEEYYHYVVSHREEVDALAKEFLIGVSQFFRDPEVWDEVAREVIPKIIAQKQSREAIRVWVLGCSTGEEAYTLGILFSEAIKQTRRPISMKIFATDVDARAIAHAGNGLYAEDLATTIPPAYLSKYFDHLGSGYRVKKAFREQFVFAVHNFISDPPFIRMDLVSCRNALIYIQASVQQKILQSFRFSLGADGFLVLGKSESLGEMKSAFHTIASRSKIYRANADYEFRGRNASSAPVPKVAPAPPASAHLDKPLIGQVSDPYIEVLAEQHAPDSIFVNANLDVLYIHGGADRYLKMPHRQVRLHLDQMVAAESAILIKSGVNKALARDTPLVYEDVVLQANERVSLRFQRYEHSGFDDTVVLIEFFDARKESGAQVERISVDALAQERIQQLEKQVVGRDHSLQELQEQLETSNEELQASNEELLSSNQELQSSNEELQSLNEELFTVNTELEEKVEELLTTNSDIDNLLKSTQIATLFLDRGLRIRMFTPAITEIIPINNHDRGRAIDHFSINLQETDLVAHIRQVLDQKQSIEREVATRDNKRFLLRIFPYRKSNQTTDGLGITLVNLTEIKKARQAIRDAKNYAESIVNSVPDPLVVLNSAYQVVSANPSFYEVFRSQPEDTLNRTIYDLEEGAWNIEKLRHLLEDVIPNNSVVNNYKIWQAFPKIGPRVMQLNAVRIIQHHDLPPLILLSIQDITEKETAEQQVRDTAGRLRLVLASSKTGVWDWDLRTDAVVGNDRWYTLFGLSEVPEVTVGQVLDRIHPEDLPRISEAIEDSIRRDAFYNEDFRIVHEDGTTLYVNGQGSVLRDAKGQPVKMLGTNLDITRRKTDELALQATNRKLQVANEYLDNFVFMAAHDLRSPVANLKSLTNLWRTGVQGELVVDKIERSVDRLDNTLNGLIQILNIQQNEPERVSTIRFADLYERLAAEMESVVQSTQARIRTRFDEPTICYVEPFLESILRNLLSNALKYRSPQRTLEVTLRTWRDASRVLVQIQDNGRGIDLSRGHSKLFKAFERLTLEGEGQGIGMHLIKNMVEKNGGSVMVASEVNRGTTFTLYLKPYELNG